MAASTARKRVATRKTRAAPERETLPAEIRLSHKASGREQRVPTGFAWDLFLFAGVLGLPLFRRHLPHWGAAVLLLWLLVLGANALRLGATTESEIELALTAVFFLLQLWLGFYGNRLMARTLIAHGWTIEQANDSGTKRVIAKWKLV